MSEELFSYSDSHNIGFFLNNDIQDAQLKALNRREQWMQGAYNYANADRDQTCRDRSNLLFGEGVIPLSDKENSAYFLGDAALREMGYMGSPLEYFYAQQKDLPADVTDEDTARIHVGKMLLDEMRKAYDTSQKTKKEALQNVDALLDGKLTPEQLTEQQINDIKDTGLALNDIMAARRGLEYTNRSVLDKLEQAGEEGYEAIKNNLVSIYENLIKGTAQGVYYTLTGSPEKAPDAGELIGNHVKNTISNISAPYRAFSDNIHMADFLRSHDGDKQVVISLIGDKLRRNAAKKYSEGNMGEHLLNVMDSEISALAETISMLSPENQPNTSSWKASSRAMMNRMDYLAFIRDAMQTGRNEAREQQDSNWLESAGEMSIQLLPYLTGSGEVLGGLRVAQEGIGRAIAALTDKDGVTPDLFTSEGAQAFGKGLVQGQADAAIRGISTRAIGRTFSKLAPKAAAQWGTKTMSRYGAALAAEWGVTTANFAVFLPLAEGGVNFLYDTIIPHDPKLDTGKKQLQQLWDDIGKLDYWGGNAVAGIAWGTAGGYATRNNALSSSRLNDIFRMEGLKEEAITEAQKIPDLKERAEAMDAAIKKQAKEDPNGTLKHALAETKKIKSKAEQEAAIKRAQETKKDEAAKAALQLLGISAEANPDPSQVDIYIGGKYNETTKSYEKGATKVTLSAADADLYLGSIMNKSFDALTHRIRESYGAENIMGELSKLYGDRIKLEAILAPEMLDKARERAKEAQQMVDKRVKELMESTKDAEGKPTLSENEARKRALEEVHPSIHKTRNMGELITFGENLEKRADIEKANADKDISKMPIGTRAFVFTPIRKIGDTIRRILRYTKDVSAREIAEEYGEIYMEDYMSDTGATYTDTWRTLEDFRSTMGDKAPKLTALRSTNPQLAERIANGAQDSDITQAEMNDLRRDVREAMSLLLMSDLRGKAARGDIAIPEWARPLFNADLVARQRMETETAIAAGLRMANEMGLMNEAALKLLGVPSKELERALAAIENPTESTYYQTFQDWNLRFAEADMRLDGLSLEELDLFEQRNAAAEQELEEEQRAQEEERAKPAREAVKELEDNGITHEEAVKKVNDNIISAKEENIANNPYVEKNEAFANGECVEVTDEGGIICYSGVLNIADLKLLHNFKLGSDAETGEVNPLEGDYQADHDPIRVFQADDGTLTVISGRHRLAHAKRNGVTKIAAYVYKQNEQQDFRWAQQRDIEWNIRDNQASPLEVALYVRGELIDGVPALSADQMERSGMKRRGSLAYQGYIIGTKAADAVVQALRNEQIDTQQAVNISLFSSNPQIQAAGLRAAAEGEGKQGILTSMGIEQGRLEVMDALGLQDSEDLFGELIPNAAFQAFVDKYSKEKLKDLNARSTFLNATTKKKSDVYAKEYETTINNPSLLKSEKAKIAELKAKWQNPYFHPELREELQDAYKKADLEGWAAAEERAKQKAADTPAEEGLPLFSEDSLNFSLISDHLQSWQRDPVAELGELGRFGNNIEGKLATIGENVYDQRVITMINALRRRQIELQHIKDGSNDDAQKIFGEMAAIVNQLTSLLPSGYRFGLEPYIEFLTVYADLYGKGDPERAGKALPMDGWQDIMSRSFKKQVERLLAENMRPEDESLFFDIFNEAAVRIDLAGIYEDLKQTREKYVDLVKARWSKNSLDSRAAREAFELEKKIARQEAFDDIQAKYAEEFKTAYKAIGEMRAHRLMDKFLARVIKKLDNHRKDRILNKIARAINGLTPRKIKNGKPVHGRVEKDVYNKVQDYKRLLLMTRSEKELVDQQYADMAQMEPGAEIKVYTYDGDGSAVEITTTVQDYNTYAGFESMTAEQAEVAAASLGSFIKHGKAAWQAAEKATNDAVNEFCAPMYDKWSEDEAARKKREEQHALKPLRRNKILNALASWFNDAQLFKLCGSVDGFEHLNNLTHRIAQAHTYLLSAEKENTDWADNSLYSVLGMQGKSRREKSKAKRDFTTHINTNKECKIVLNTQPPDFAAQHLAVLRSSLLRRLFSLTRQKNFHANKFAAAVRYITDSRIMPDELVEEVNAKYGHVGNADKYSKGDFHAYNEYFRSEKFAHLLNINKTVKERTAKSLDEWNKGKFDESGNLIKAPATKRQSTITEITPNQAAYRILLAEQEDYADMLRRQGYTPQVLQQLREIAGEQMMAYAYALRERMNARTDTIKAIYEQTFGMPFPAVENYFRAYFDVSNAGKKDTFLADLSLGFGAGEGAIEIFYTRQKHNARINPTMNVTTAYGLGTAQQDVIIAYSDQQTHQHLGLFLNKILQNTKDGVRMSDVMKNGLGEEAYHALERQAENMFRLFGQSEPADKVLNRIMSDLGSASALSIINAKFSSILKNTMSLFNTLGGSDKVGAAAWYSSLMRVGTGNGKISVKQIMQEPVIRDRFKGWDYDADKAAIYGLTGENVSHGSTNAASRYGMAAFGRVDRDLTAVSAATLYDAVYRKLEKENPDITHESLHTICMDEVAQSLGLKGQPMDFRQRALNASRVDWRTLGSYFLGGESWNTFTNCMRLWAQSNVRTQEGKENLYRAAAVWITQGTVMSLLNWAYYWLTDDEEHWEKRNFLAHMTLGTLAGPISGMPIISNLVAGGISTVGRLAGWRDMPYFGTPGFFPLMDVFRTIPALKKAFLNDKLSWWDKSIIINDAVRAAAFAAIATNMRPTSKTQAATLATGVWATAISNGIDFALRLGRASEERHFADDPDESSK